MYVRLLLISKYPAGSGSEIYCRLNVTQREFVSVFGMTCLENCQELIIFMCFSEPEPIFFPIADYNWSIYTGLVKRLIWSFNLCLWINFLFFSFSHYCGLLWRSPFLIIVDCCDVGDCVRRAGEVSPPPAQQALGRAAQRGHRGLPGHLWPPPPRGGRGQRLPRLRRQPAAPAQHPGTDDQRRVVPQGRVHGSGTASNMSCMYLGRFT